MWRQNLQTPVKKKLITKVTPLLMFSLYKTFLKQVNLQAGDQSKSID